MNQASAHQDNSSALANVPAECRPASGPQRQDDKRKVTLVTTTINVPRFLAEVLENAETNGHADQLSIVVVADRKTPPEVGEFLSDLDKKHPAKVTYLDMSDQKKLMRRWPALDLFIRYDCIQRRNLGYIQAALDEAEVIITVDDDNFVTEDDFIGHHLAVGQTVTMPVVSHSSGWWNVCERLLSETSRRFYHRGFPKSLQDWEFGRYECTEAEVNVVANGGLWLGAPDVDATTHIEEPIEVIGLTPMQGSRNCALAAGTWCPLNSQNTAFDARALPAMYLPVMHDRIRGYRITRMDDIWMSYFLRAIADQRGESVTYGPPLVYQERNPHNFVTDLSRELAGYILSERLAVYLRDFKTSEADYLGAYLDLIYHLRDAALEDPEIEDPEREYLRQLTLGMAAWHQTIAEILG